MTYLKWFILGFIVSIAAWRVIGEIVLRNLKRKNRLLRLLADAGAVTAEPERGVSQGSGLAAEYGG